MKNKDLSLLFGFGIKRAGSSLNSEEKDRLARWLTGNDDAQDMVQESYLPTFKFFDAFRGVDGRAWHALES